MYGDTSKPTDEQRRQQQYQELYGAGQQDGMPPTAGIPLMTQGGVMGVGGLPQARPRFGYAAEDWIRHPNTCCGTEPGPKIPLHWYDGGNGWVTKYFTDTNPYNPNTYEAGKFKCQVIKPDGQMCNHEVKEDDCCKGNCCWGLSYVAPVRMAQHAAMVHGARPPAPRNWTSELFDTEGCLEAWFCSPCVGSRQMMALSGWEDTFHCGWCAFFTFMGFRVARAGGRAIVYWIPPHFYVALFTRRRVMTLNNIDENCCKTCMVILCCPVCSAAQTYRELSASGVWPGTSCCSEKPANYGQICAPAMNQKMMV